MNGIINLRKEAGMTSHDAVFKLRKILKTKKIGHGGTLDPDVVGVLPIAVGKATRLVEFMQEEGKVYEGEITLGCSTTTEDASGDILERTPVTELLEEALIDEAMESMTGEIRQIPPMYSAVKVNGRKLYEYAMKMSKPAFVFESSAARGPMSEPCLLIWELSLALPVTCPS